MSAYFVEALNDIKFFEDEAEYIFRPFRDIYEDFKKVYGGYEYMGEEQRRIIVRKLSQYYYKLRDRKVDITEE